MAVQILDWKRAAAAIRAAETQYTGEFRDDYYNLDLVLIQLGIDGDDPRQLNALILQTQLVTYSAPACASCFPDISALEQQRLAYMTRQAGLELTLNLGKMVPEHLTSGEIAFELVRLPPIDPAVYNWELLTPTEAMLEDLDRLQSLSTTSPMELASFDQAMAKMHDKLSDATQAFMFLTASYLVTDIAARFFKAELYSSAVDHFPVAMTLMASQMVPRHMLKPQN